MIIGQIKRQDGQLKIIPKFYDKWWKYHYNLSKGYSLRSTWVHEKCHFFKIKRYKSGHGTTWQKQRIYKLFVVDWCDNATIFWISPQRVITSEECCDKHKQQFATFCHVYFKDFSLLNQYIFNNIFWLTINRLGMQLHNFQNHLKKKRRTEQESSSYVVGGHLASSSNQYTVNSFNYTNYTSSRFQPVL